MKCPVKSFLEAIELQLYDLNDPELGLRGQIPRDWVVSYDEERDIILFYDKNFQKGIGVLRNYLYIISNKDEFSNLIKNILQCDKILDLHETRSEMLSLRCVRGTSEFEVLVQIVGDKNLIKIGFYPINEHETRNDILSLMNNLVTYPSSIGRYDIRKRVSSPQFKWLVTIPNNWSIQPYGLFGDGFIASSGRIIVWLDVYPIFNLGIIDAYGEARINKLIMDGKILNVEKFRHEQSIAWKVKAKFGDSNIILVIQLAVHKLQLDEHRAIDILVESGYIVPEHVDKIATQVAEEILSSYAMGPNFLREYLEMSDNERLLYALVKEATTLRRDINSYFAEALKSVQNLDSVLSRLILSSLKQ